MLNAPSSAGLRHLCLDGQIHNVNDIMLCFNIIRQPAFETGRLRPSDAHLRGLIKRRPEQFIPEGSDLSNGFSVHCCPGGSDNEVYSFVPDGAGDTSASVSPPRVRKGKRCFEAALFTTPKVIAPYWFYWSIFIIFVGIGPGI